MLGEEFSRDRGKKLKGRIRYPRMRICFGWDISRFWRFG